MCDLIPISGGKSKDFPMYEMKIKASLHKFNMHHLLDNNAMTKNEANQDISAKPTSALLLSLKNKHQMVHGMIPSNAKNAVSKCGSIYALNF